MMLYKNYNQKSHIMSIGKAKRRFLDEEKQYLPGVGSYNVLHSQFNNTRGRTFTRAARSMTQEDQTKISEHHQSSFTLKPGPGSYSVELKRSQKLMSFTHSKRFLSNNNKIPGPGSYKSQQCSKQKIKAGIICRSARKTINLRENIPGPCDYSQPQIILYKKKDPIAAFGKAKRNLDVEKNETSNNSRENFRRSLLESNNQSLTNKNVIHLQRNRQSRRIEKQAKIVQKDQVPILL